MQVNLKIEVGNEAMQTRTEIADALRKVANEFEQTGRYHIPVVDANGNYVGDFRLTTNSN